MPCQGLLFLVHFSSWGATKVQPVSMTWQFPCPFFFFCLVTQSTYYKVCHSTSYPIYILSNTNIGGKMHSALFLSLQIIQILKQLYKIPLPMMHIPLVFITNIVLRCMGFFLNQICLKHKKYLHQKEKIGSCVKFLTVFGCMKYTKICVCIRAKAVFSRLMHRSGTLPLWATSVTDGCGAGVFFYISPLFSYFEQESAVFNKEASSIFKGLSRVVSCFTDEEKLPLARETLEKAHTPHTISTTPRQHLAVTAVGSFFPLLSLVQM